MIRLLFVCAIMMSVWSAKAQMQQIQAPRLAQIYLETSAQSKQRITQLPGETYRLSAFSFGAILPLYAKTFRQQKDTIPPSRLAFSLHPSLTYSLLSMSSPQQERVLLNPQISVSTYYMFGQKNRFFLTVKALLNEDEFTINDPKPRYAFSTLYSHKVSTRFSYYGGAAYSFVFGEGRLLPLLGARFSWGTSSAVNIVLPVQVSYRTKLSQNIRLSVYVRPQGGVNRFENRLTIADSVQKVLLFRRSGLIMGTSFSFWVKNNLAVVVDPSLLLAQKIAFTDDGTGTQHFIDNNLSRGFQLRLMLIWRPWQNTLRNQQHKEVNTTDDDNFLLGL